MTDGVGGADAVAVSVPEAAPGGEEKCLLVDRAPSDEILTGRDGGTYIVLRTPIRPDEDPTEYPATSE